MPVLLLLLAGGGFGAYFGAQLDDKLDTPLPVHPMEDNSVNWTKIALYSAAGMALFWLARKSGVIGALKK